MSQWSEHFCSAAGKSLCCSTAAVNARSPSRRPCMPGEHRVRFGAAVHAHRGGGGQQRGDPRRRRRLDGHVGQPEHGRQLRLVGGSHRRVMLGEERWEPSPAPGRRGPPSRPDDCCIIASFVRTPQPDGPRFEHSAIIQPPPDESGGMLTPGSTLGVKVIPCNELWRVQLMCAAQAVGRRGVHDVRRAAGLPGRAARGRRLPDRRADVAADPHQLPHLRRHWLWCEWGHMSQMRILQMRLLPCSAFTSLERDRHAAGKTSCDEYPAACS